MIQLVIVLAGSLLLLHVLFVRARNPDAILSPWRWMLSTWGALTLFAFTSPVTYDRMKTSTGTIVYLVAWVAAFVLGDVWGSRWTTAADVDGPGPETPGDPQAGAEDARAEGRPAGAEEPTLGERGFRLLIAISVIGATGFAYLMLSAVGSYEQNELLAELRALQIAGEVVSPGATVLQVMAFAGLPAALIAMVDAIRHDRPVSLLAWVGILASASVYMTTAGRQGLVITSMAAISALVAAFAFRRADRPYPFKWRMFGPLLAVLVLFGGYFIFNVMTRSTEGGNMDTKLEMIERVYGAYVDSGFRESVRPLGSFGDTLCELYLYLGTQLPGLTALLRDYAAPVDLGLGLVPQFTRRIEWLFGVDLLDPLYEAQKNVFLNLGMPGNFYLTAAGSTFEAFGRWAALVMVWAGGVFSGWYRARVLRRTSGARVALLAMLCSGAAFTIIYTPTVEAGWVFPVMWLVVIPPLFGLGPRSSQTAPPALPT